MPGGDGTGPLGNGPMTGRGRGYCVTSGFRRPTMGRGMGQGMRRGFGCGMGRGMGRGMGQGMWVQQQNMNQNRED